MVIKPTREELEERVKQPEKEPFELGKVEAEMALFRRFTEASGQGLGMADLEGNVIYTNPTLCRFMGEERPEALIGKDVRTFYTKEELPILENEILPAVFKDDNKTAEISLLSLKGELTHTIQNVFLIRNEKGEPVCLANVITDITDRKQAERELERYRDHLEKVVAERNDGLRRTNEELQREVTERRRAEEALRESEEKYRELVDLLPQPIFEIDEKGNVTLTNRVGFESFGYSQQNLDKGVNALQLFVPGDHDRLQEAIRKILGGQELSRDEFTALRNDGSTFPVIIRASRIIRDGNPIGIRGIVIDISIHKQAEDELKELEAQLRQAQKLESIGTLTSGVAHNFRNILGSLSLFNQLVQVKYEHDPYLQEMAGKADKSVKKGAELVQELLQFSRERAKEFETINVAEVVRETYDMTRHSFDRKINISIDVPDSLFVRGDHSGLSQALMNLYNNARDAMPKGGKLVIEARKEGEYALILISDTGHGMVKETQEKCFDPFFTTKGVENGTGLGLSTTYGIVKDHGGKIHVTSELNKGTTFKLHFPLALSDEKPKQTGASEIEQGKSQKVLVVDDEEDLLEGVEMLVECLGYRTASADNAKAAIEKYKSWQPDMVLLDRNMPEIDGITCAKRIIEYDPRARIVLVSGYDQEGPGGIDDKTKALIKGYLTKPIDMEEVGQLLSRLLAVGENHAMDSQEQLPTGKELILFVDDEIPIAKMGSQILEHFGYSVTTRTSSIEALEIFQAKPTDFDLVITDMTMPNLTGDKLAVELKKIRSDIPIILCTGHGKKVSDEIASDIGINAVAYKPVTKADLEKMVRTVLDRAKSENQGE